MILFHLETSGQKMAGITLFSGLPTVFHHIVSLICFREGEWYAV